MILCSKSVIDCRDTYSGYTPLHLAVMNNNFELVEVLFSNGAGNCPNY